MQALKALEIAANVNEEKEKAERAKHALEVAEEEKQAALWFEREGKTVILELIKSAAVAGRTSTVIHNLPVGWVTNKYKTLVIDWLRGLGYQARYRDDSGWSKWSVTTWLEVNWGE